MGLKVVLFNRLATNQYGCDEKPDFARLTDILAKAVKKVNKTHSDGSGCQQISTNRQQIINRAEISGWKGGFANSPFEIGADIPRRCTG